MVQTGPVRLTAPCEPSRGSAAAPVIYEKVLRSGRRKKEDVVRGHGSGRSHFILERSEEDLHHQERNVGESHCGRCKERNRLIPPFPGAIVHQPGEAR